jgi:hypothetical protein
MTQKLREVTGYRLEVIVKTNELKPSTFNLKPSDRGVY